MCVKSGEEQWCHLITKLEWWQEMTHRLIRPMQTSMEESKALSFVVS